MKSSSLSTAPLSRGKYVVQQSIFSEYVKRKRTQTNAGLTFILGLRVQDYSCQFRSISLNSCYALSSGSFYTLLILYSQLRQFLHSTQIIFSAHGELLHSTQMKLSAQGNYTLNSDYTLSSGNFYTQLRLYSQLRKIVRSTEIKLSSQGKLYTQLRLYRQTS
jgi:hypothetical protein